MRKVCVGYAWGMREVCLGMIMLLCVVFSSCIMGGSNTVYKKYFPPPCTTKNPRLYA